MLHFPAFWNAIDLALSMHWAAAGNAPQVGVDAARLLANAAVYCAPLLLVWGWLRRPEAQRLPRLNRIDRAVLAPAIRHSWTLRCRIV